MPKRVLMLGWELPPYNSGGLGEACLGLARALSRKGIAITFVLPKRLKLDIPFMDIIFADIDEGSGSLLSCYATYQSWKKLFPADNFPPLQDFFGGALQFAKKIELIVKNMKDKVDIIHAHDWMTYPAAQVAKEILGKPLITHVHSTEFDRTGGNYPNRDVFLIEKHGFRNADKVVPVGGFMKNILINKYDVTPDKIRVIYNGIDCNKKDLSPALTAFKQMGYKIVLFLGRITLQKGPEYFVRTAKVVSQYYPKVIFVVTGSGDMESFMITEAARLGILDKFIFTGFLRGDDKDRIYQSADLYVLPSVSEPFGITALEAIVNGTPVLVSKQSGVSEILRNALKVDFWDIDEMANKILAAIKYKSLRKDLRTEGGKEVRLYSWDRSADEMIDVYNSLI